VRRTPGGGENLSRSDHSAQARRASATFLIICTAKHGGEGGREKRPKKIDPPDRRTPLCPWAASARERDPSHTRARHPYGMRKRAQDFTARRRKAQRRAYRLRMKKVMLMKLIKSDEAGAAPESSLTILCQGEHSGESAEEGAAEEGEAEAGMRAADVESTARDAGNNGSEGVIPRSPPCRARIGIPPQSPPSRRARRRRCVIRSVEEMMRKLVPILPRGRKLRVLDLCSGSCTLLDALQAYLPTILQRFEYVSVDTDPQVGSRVDGHVHICGDVRDWREVITPRYKPGYFDVVWASPPCRVFSHAKTNASPKDLADGISIVAGVKETIAFLKPPSWFIENPRGRLAQQAIMNDEGCPLMRDSVRLLVSYCRYGAWYRKDTHLWTNVRSLVALRCTAATPCSWLSGGWRRHPRTAQNGPTNGLPVGVPRATAYKPPIPLLVGAIKAGLEQAGAVRRAGASCSRGPC